MLLPPQYPYSLQQSPQREPAQVKPWAPPQLPSTETFTSGVDEEVAAGAEEEGSGTGEDVSGTGDGVTVDKVEVVDGADGVEVAEGGVTETTTDVDVGVDTLVEVENGFLIVQSPKPTWHPVPQCNEVRPQNPLLLQQFPNTEFLHVSAFLDCVPQRSVVLMLRASAPRNGMAATANRIAECIVGEVGLENE